MNIGGDNNKLPEFSLRERRLISTMTTLKAAAADGSYFFFMEMCDADGVFTAIDEDFSWRTADGVEMDGWEKYGEPCLPWNEDFKEALQGEGRQWAWEGADHALLRFITDVLNEDDWTLESLNESIMIIITNWADATIKLKKVADDNGIPHNDIQIVMDAVTEVAMFGKAEDATIWAITCVIHKSTSHFHECISWTEKRVEKIVSILVKVGAIDKIPKEKGDENNE